MRETEKEMRLWPDLRFLVHALDLFGLFSCAQVLIFQNGGRLLFGLFHFLGNLPLLPGLGLNYLLDGFDADVVLFVFVVFHYLGVDQVWSLTQFYSVDFSQSRIGVNKCIFNKRTIKVCVSCCGRCPGTSAPSVPYLTVSLNLCSSGSNARDESRAREGRRVRSKSPSRV